MGVLATRKKNILILLSLLFLLLFLLFAWRQAEILLEEMNTRISALLSEGIEGELEWERVSLFPFNRIIFHQLKMIGDQGDLLLTIERLVVRYNPLYLFAEGIGIIGGISHIQVFSPALYVTEREGVFNIESYLASSDSHLFSTFKSRISIYDGFVDLDSQSYGHISMTDVRALMDLSPNRVLGLDVSGDIALEEGVASLFLYGGVEEEISHLQFDLQGLPLSFLELPYLTGEGITDIRVSYAGSLKEGDVNGEIHLREGGFLYEDVELKGTEARIVFAKEDLSLEALLQGEGSSLLSFDELEGLFFDVDLMGEAHHTGVTEYRLSALLEEEEIDVSFFGADLPLSLLPIAIPQLDLDLKVGDGELKVRGGAKDLYIEGDLLLKGASAFDQERSIKVEGIHGSLSFAQEGLILHSLSPLSYETSSLPSIQVNVKGLLEGFPLSAQGSLQEEEWALSVKGQELPLSLLDPFFEEEWEILHGRVSGDLMLKGSPSSSLLQGHLMVEEAMVYSLLYDYSLQEGQGGLTFSYSSPLGIADVWSDLEREDLSLEDLSLDQLYVEGHLQGELEGAPFWLEIGFLEEALSLSLRGEGAQLEALPFIQLQDIEDLFLLCHLQLDLWGEVEALNLSLDLNLVEGSLYYPKDDLLFSPLQGQLSFSAVKQSLLPLEDLLDFSFEDLSIQGVIAGGIEREGHFSPLLLQGKIEKGAVDLSITGEDLPLALLSHYIEIPYVEDLEGLSTIDLFVLGDRESLSLSGEIELKEAQLMCLPEDLRLSHLQGALSIEVVRPLPLETMLEEIVLEDLIVSASLKGHVYAEDLSSSLSLEGAIDRGNFHLSLRGEELPLPVISRRADLPLEILSGLLRGAIHLEGDRNGISVSGEGELLETEMRYSKEDLLFSQVEGPFSFIVERPLAPSLDSLDLSWDDLQLRADLSGAMKGSSLSPLLLSLELNNGLLNLSLLGEDLPLALLSRAFDLSQGEILGGEGDLSLLLSGDIFNPAIQGEMALRQGEAALFSPSLSLFDLEGGFSFSSPQALSSIEEWQIEGELKGVVAREEEASFLALEGGLRGGDLCLYVTGEGLPLSFFQEELASYGLASVKGFGSLNLSLLGTLNEALVKGDVIFRDVSMTYVEEDVALSAIEGHITFSIEDPIPFGEPLAIAFEAFELQTSLVGEHALLRERGPFAIEGGLKKGLFQLEGEAENLPLERLSSLPLPIEIEDLKGLSDLQLSMRGSLEEIVVSGALSLEDLGFYYVKEDLLLSSIAGDVIFSTEKPILFSSLSLEFKDIRVNGALQGEHALIGEGGSFAIEGEWREGFFELEGEAENLPLERLSSLPLPLEIEDLKGLSDLQLSMRGSLEEIVVSGALSLKELGFYYVKEDLLLSSVAGDVIFSIEKPILLSSPSLEFEDIRINGALQGEHALIGEGGSFALEGEWREGLFQLEGEAENLPLEYLSSLPLPIEIEDLKGLSDLQLSMRGSLEEIALSGSLSLKELGFYYVKEDLLLSSVAGDVIFSIEKPILLSSPSLDFEDIRVNGALQGEHALIGEGGSFALEGEWREGLFQLEGEAENLPLERLSSLPLPIEIEDLKGFGQLEISLFGSLTELKASGKMKFHEAALAYREQDLSLSMLEGEISFALEDPIELSPSPSIELEDLYLAGSLKGEYSLQGEGGSFSLEGLWHRDHYSLALQGENGPLHLLPLDEIEGDLKNLYGYGAMDLFLEGSKDSLKGSLSIDLSHGKGELPSLDLSFRDVEGLLYISLLSPLSFPLQMPPLDQLQLKGDLSGLYQLKGEEGLFSIQGEMREEQLILNLSSHHLPLHHLPLGLPAQVEDLLGYASLNLRAHGPIGALRLQGELDLLSSSLQIPEYNLAISSVKGPLSFRYNQTIDLEDPSFSLAELHLQGALSGSYLLEGEGGDFSIEGGLSSALHADITIEGLPLRSIAQHVSIPQLEDLGGYSTVRAEARGPLEDLSLSGSIDLERASGKIVAYHLALSSVEGLLSFSLQESISLEMGLSSLQREDLSIEGSLKGLLTHERERSHIFLTGQLKEGLLDLVVEGSSLPLSFLPVEDLGLESLGGYGSGHLQLQGDIDALALSGEVRLRDVGVDLPAYELSLYGLLGRLAFSLEEPLKEKDFSTFDLKDLDIEVSLLGRFLYQGERSTFVMEGDLKEKVLDLRIEGTSLPLSLLPAEDLGLESLVGYGLGHLHLQGDIDALALSGEVRLRDVGAGLVDYDLSLSQLRGQLAFQVEDLQHILSKELEGLSLEANLSADVNYGGSIVPLKLSGFFEDMALDFLIKGDFLPLSLLPAEELDLPALTGHSSASIQLTGSPSSLSLRGELSLKEGGAHLTPYQVSLSNVEGALSFYLEEIPSTSSSFDLLDLHLKGSVRGYLEHSEEKGRFSLEGQLIEGLFYVDLLGEELPYHLLSSYDLVEVQSFTGLTRADLRLGGDLKEESFNLSGDLEISEGGLFLPSYGIHLSSIEGEIAFFGLSLEEDLSSLLGQVELTGELEGDLFYEEERGLFSLAGQLKEGHLHLQVKGEDLPHQLFSSYTLGEANSLAGLKSIGLDLSGNLREEAFAFSLDLLFFDGALSLPSYGAALSSLQGALTIHNKEPWALGEPLSFVEMDLYGDITGYLLYEEIFTSIKAKGQLEDGLLSLSLIGEEINLSPLSSYLPPEWGLLGGHGMVELDLLGELEDLAIKGRGEIFDGEISYPSQNLSLSSLSGSLFFEATLPSSLDDLSLGLSLETIELTGELDGLLGYGEEETPVTLMGDVAEGDLDLVLVALGLSLEVLERELFPDNQLALGGLGDLSLEVKGRLDAMAVGGSLELQDASLLVPEEELYFTSLGGHLFFSYLPPLTIEDASASFNIEDLLLFGEIEGLGELRGESFSLAIEGESIEGEMDLKAQVLGLSLEAIDRELLPPQASSLTGAGDLHLHLQGGLTSFTMSGELELEEVSLSLRDEELLLASLGGHLFFSYLSPLSIEGPFDFAIESFHLFGEGDGLGKYRGEGLSYSFAMELVEGELDGIIKSQGAPLHLLAQDIDLREYEVLLATGDVRLSLSGSLHQFYLSGEVQLLDASIQTPFPHLRANSIEGPITFAVERDLNPSLQLQGLALEEVSLWMDLHGLLFQKEDSFPFNLGGSLEKGYSHLVFHGQEIPLGAYASYLPEGEGRLLGGLGELLLYSRGPKEDFSIEGVLEAENLFIDFPRYHISLSKGQGEVIIENQGFALERLAEDFPSSSFIFHLLALGHPGEREPKPLEIQGIFKERDLSLSLKGEDLPIEFLSIEGSRFLEQEFPFQAQKGEVDLTMELHKAFSDPQVEGHGALRGATLYYEKDGLLFEEVSGQLSFTTDVLSLEGFVGFLEGGELELQGEVLEFRELDLDLIFSSQNPSLLRELLLAFSYDGSSSGRLSILGEIEEPLVYGHIELEDVYLLDYYLPWALFDLHYHKEKFMLMDLKASLLGGAITGYGSLDISGEEPHYSASLGFLDLDLAPGPHIPEDLKGLLSGEVYLSGDGSDLEHLQLIGSLSLNEGSYGDFDFQGLSSDFWLYDGIFHISHGDLHIYDGSIAGYGSLDLEGELQMKIESQGQGLSIREILGEDLMVRLQGQLGGNLSSPIFSGEVTLALIEERDIALEVEVKRESFLIKRGSLLGLGEELSLEGSYDFEEQDLQLSLSFLQLPLEKLASLFPSDLPFPSTGKTTGEVYIGGSMERPNIKSSLFFRDVDWEGLRLVDLSFEVAQEGDSIFIQEGQLRFDGGYLDLYGEVSKDLALSLQLKGQSLSTETILSFIPDPPPLLEDVEGDVDFYLKLTGSLEEWEAQGSIRGEALYWRGVPFELARGDFRYVGQILHLPALYVFRGGDGASLEGSIDFNDSSIQLIATLERVSSETALQLLDLNTLSDSSFLFQGDLLLYGPLSHPAITFDLEMSAKDQEGQVQIWGDLFPVQEDLLLYFDAQDFPIEEILPFMGLSYPLYGAITLTGEVTGPLSSPQLATYDFSLKEGGIGEHRIESIEGEILLQEGGILKVFQSIQIGGTEIALGGSYGLTTEELDLRLVVEEGDLSSISPIIPLIQEARGGFALDLHVGGSLLKPLFSGTMELEQGDISFDQEEIFPITDLSGSLVFHHHFVDVQSLSGEYGEGPFQLYGEIGLSGLSVIYLALSFTGEDLPLVYGSSRAHLYPSLRVEGSWRHPYIKGEIGLANTVIYFPIEAPEVFNEDQALTPLVDIHLYPKGEILLEDDRMSVFLEEGSLRLENLAGEYLLLGEVRSSQGSFQVLNNYFQLEEAKATFTRFYPNMPRISGQVYTYFSAERRIFVQIEGLADDLTFTFSAENGMSEHEILAALAGAGDLKLITGDFQDLTGDLWRFLVQSLRLDFLIQLEDALAATFDLDEVLIIQDMEENIQLRVGKFIIDDLYLTYRRTLSARAKQEMGFEYRLNPYTMFGGTLYEDGEFRLMIKGSWPF